MESRRECGECNACCDFPSIAELNKPGWTLCARYKDGKCSQYSDRPQCCRNFECLWLSGALADDMRPDKCGLMFWFAPNPNGVGHILRVAEMQDGAYDRLEGITDFPPYILHKNPKFVK